MTNSVGLLYFFACGFVLFAHIIFRFRDNNTDKSVGTADNLLIVPNISIMAGPRFPFLSFVFSSFKSIESFDLHFNHECLILKGTNHVLGYVYK